MGGLTRVSTVVTIAAKDAATLTAIISLIRHDKDSEPAASATMEPPATLLAPKEEATETLQNEAMSDLDENLFL